MLKTLLTATAVLTATAALAAPTNVTLDRNGAITRFTGSAHMAPAQFHAPKGHGATIFSNITQPYNANEGWTLSGSSSSPIGQTIFLAEAFTPTAAATVKEIDVAVGWVEGNNGVTVGLYADASGVPGKKLGEKTVTNLTQFGQSSTAVGVAKIKSVKVKANTQYWVAITFSKKYANEWAAWNFTNDNSNAITAATNNGSGWTATQLTPGGGFAVYD